MLRRTGNRAGILILACMLAASPTLAQITTGTVTATCTTSKAA